MNYEVQIKNGNVAVIKSADVLISDVASALDLMATVHHVHQCDSLILNKEAVCDDFFVLSTGIAGDVLQKYVNYNMKLAIIGDYSNYTSKALKDFIYESNKGRHVLFINDEEEAIKRFAQNA